MGTLGGGTDRLRLLGGEHLDRAPPGGARVRSQLGGGLVSSIRNRLYQMVADPTLTHDVYYLIRYP